jgi:hypothetical protein
MSGPALAVPSAPSLRARAVKRLEQGDLGGAVDDTLRALRLEPSEAELARRLSVVLGEVGRHALAEPLRQGLKEADNTLYQQTFLKKRRTRYLDYPSHVHLETLARCNARCTFCPSPELERSGTRMEDAVIDKVLTDLEDVPRDLPFRLSPFKVNEPLLDVRIFDILDRIEDRLPNADIDLTTNGSALTDRTRARLSGRRTLNAVYVSFNDHRPQVYEQVMGLPFDRTVARLDALHDDVSAGTLAVRVQVSRVGDGTPDDDAFRSWVVRRWPAFQPVVLRRGDWLGQVDERLEEVPNVACLRWFELSITATGTVAHCCMDGQARHPIGDIRERHVLEVYNDPSWRRLRETLLTRRDTHPCSGCTFL